MPTYLLIISWNKPKQSNCSFQKLDWKRQDFPVLGEAMLYFLMLKVCSYRFNKHLLMLFCLIFKFNVVLTWFEIGLNSEGFFFFLWIITTEHYLNVELILKATATPWIKRKKTVSTGFARSQKPYAKAKFNTILISVTSNFWKYSFQG